MASLNQDRTANRVALCSAIFARFAYVGYAVVRTAFGGRRREEINNGFFRNENDVLGLEYEGDQARARGQQRLYMRRLSGSSCPAPSSRRELAAADIRQVTQQLDSAEAGDRCVLRPLSVRERLREMNLNAMAFADTLLILHGKKPLGPRRLHGSPFHSD